MPLISNYGGVRVVEGTRVKVADIYNAALARKIVRTKDEFSTSLLCMHWSYYVVMGERVTVGPLLSLWERLQALGHVDLALLVFGMIRERTNTHPAPLRPCVSDRRVLLIPADPAL